MVYMFYTHSKLSINCIIIFMTSFASFYFDKMEHTEEFLVSIDTEGQKLGGQSSIIKQRVLCNHL